MKAYKLLTQGMTSHYNHKWEIGIKQTIDEPGTEMCSNQVFHCYNHPMLAVIFNPIHRNIKNPRLFEIKVDEFVNNDGLKFASKSQTIITEIDLPKISTLQITEFSIRVSKLYCKDIIWNAWADKWLDESDRSESAARSAAWSAAGSAAWSAWSAWSAARSAAWSAAGSAESAAGSAESAAWSAWSAAWSAESAAWSAESAAWLAESAALKLFNQNMIDVIESIVNQ